MFTVIVLLVCFILFFVERRLNARSGTRKRSNVPVKRVSSPRRK